MKQYLLFIFCFGVYLMQPLRAQNKSTAYGDVPNWAKEAIWYQIYPDIFRNGDQGNDPTLKDIYNSYPGPTPKNWHVTSWGQDFYKLDDYCKEVEGKIDVDGNEIKYFGQFQALRHYGGDLQGIIDKLDYLESLGINALYVQPIYDGASNHNFDARNWRHVDVNFGPDPLGDRKIMNEETPDDPATWRWTAGDKLLLKLIDEVHQRNMKIILDYSWNHVGRNFWAWEDVLKNQQNSRYVDWFWIDEFDNPTTPENEFSYPKWLEVTRELVQVKETEYVSHNPSSHYWEGDVYSQAIKEHIFSVTRRWLDPNEDGDPSDGIDGYRIDVVAELPLGFLRQLRKVVREVNPEAILIGESWFGTYPDEMLDPKPILEGDIADGVMNYRWFKAARGLFIHPEYAINPSAFMDSISRITSNLRWQNTQGMMNTGATHDTPRLVTSVFNYDMKYKYGGNSSPESTYKISKPDAAAENTAKMILVNQFTYVGAPHIWQGEEMGQWGADFPENRKPMIWDDITYEDEIIDPYNREKTPNKVEVNQDMLKFYKQLTSLRKENSVLAHGNLEFIHHDDDNRTLGYKRSHNEDEILVFFNTSFDNHNVTVDLENDVEYLSFFNQNEIKTTNGKLKLSVPSRGYQVLIKQAN